ncbi:hypothetical protein [Sedimentisphaera salicampi]|uniref:hypothetical protein n=1 Tax=Sedimentisphaera salicampi TaxID=1941349 RepID=UPI000B9D24F0|nr:hypothetical protein [Sedimentisphaera salicampi]OXU16213.1 hypothetical protein SMSP1_00057 [Sedimentisphaera salicampi]
MKRLNLASNWLMDLVLKKGDDGKKKVEKILFSTSADELYRLHSALLEVHRITKENEEHKKLNKTIEDCLNITSGVAAEISMREKIMQ